MPALTDLVRPNRNPDKRLIHKRNRERFSETLSCPPHVHPTADQMTSHEKETKKKKNPPWITATCDLPFSTFVIRILLKQCREVLAMLISNRRVYFHFIPLSQLPSSNRSLKYIITHSPYCAEFNATIESPFPACVPQAPNPGAKKVPRPL